MRWWLPPQGSTFAPHIDAMFTAILIITGIAVVLEEESEDVIHSVFIPVFRLRQDAVPGMHIRSWFMATTPGHYELACSQLCGMGHYKMHAQVVVETQAEFDAWLAKAAQGDI